MDIFQFYELSRSRSGVAYFPFIDSIQAYIRVSTRNGNMLVKWGDGTEQQLTTSKNVDSTVTSPTMFSHTYSANYTGDVQVIFRQGLRDVYSIHFWFPDVGGNYRYLNIQDIKTFFAQFPNLYSVFFDIYSYLSYTTVIKGDFSQLPNSVERVRFEGWDVKNNGVDQWLNISNYSPDSKLKYFNFSKEGYGVYPHVTLKVNGDLSKIPSSCSFFKIASGGTYAGSSITYTAGKVWANAFDTLSIPLSLGNFLEADVLFTDMGNSITSAVGGKVISIGGWFSGTAKLAYLKSLGFTISGLDTSTGSASSTTQKFIGDIAQIPSDVTLFKIVQCATGSVITYTSGKVWASSFDTLFLPIQLTPNENDNLLIDLYNSVTTAIGGKSITLDPKGYRTIVSDVAVAGLISKYFAVNCPKLSYTSAPILDLPLQNSFTDVSPSAISMVAGNVNGLPSFVSDGSGGYAVDFGGTKSIKTSVNLPINTSDKVSIEFDIKTSATAAQLIMELSPNVNSNNSFAVFINDTLANKIEIVDHNSGLNVGNSAVTINDGNYHSVKMVIDRSLGTAQNKIYVDGVLSYVQYMTYTVDNNGNFGSFTLFIGQRNGSSVGFVGQLKNLKIYNYPIL